MVSSLRLFRLTCQLSGVTFSVATQIVLSVSITSRTLMMPGCRKVRSLRAAFLAKGNRDLLRTMSKVKTLHAELSS
jgi:hypothetical protein